MSENNSLVSICLITYNHEQYIGQALESILMQKTSFPIEVIVADDCSKDNTRQIVRDYHARYPDKIKLLFQEKNVGGGKNFVDLINSASGEYIAYLEGDDYWTDPLKLQKQFDFMESHPDFSICYHKIKWHQTSPVDEVLTVESNENDSRESTIDDLFEKGWFIRSCSMFFRKFELPEGFEKLYVGDYPLHILLADRGKIGFLNEAMGNYRIHSQGYSEMNLITPSLEKRKQNFRNEIELYKYLDAKTNFRYSKHFNKKLFDVFYGHLWFMINKSKSGLMHELYAAFKMLGLWFITLGTVRKVSSKIIGKR